MVLKFMQAGVAVVVMGSFGEAHNMNLQVEGQQL